MLSFRVLLILIIFTTSDTDWLVRNRALNSCLSASCGIISRRHWWALPAEGIYCVYISRSKNRIEGANIIPSSLLIPIFVTSSPLRFLFLLTSEINGASSETFLLQYFRISFWTLNANLKNIDVLFLYNLSATWPLLFVFCVEKGTNSSFVFFTILFSVFKQVTLLSRSTRNRVISFVATSFSIGVFSSFFFYILYTFSSFGKRFRFSFTRSNFSFQEFSPTNTSPSIFNSWASASWIAFNMGVYSSHAMDCCVSTGCGLDDIAFKSPVSVDTMPSCYTVTRFPSSSVNVSGRSPEVEVPKLTEWTRPRPQTQLSWRPRLTPLQTTTVWGSWFREWSAAASGDVL